MDSLSPRYLRLPTGYFKRKIYLSQSQLLYGEMVRELRARQEVVGRIVVATRAPLPGFHIFYLTKITLVPGGTFIQYQRRP